MGEDGRPVDANADTTWQQVPLDGLVELRVHGVGGTPAEEMLDDPHPVQVSGDRIAGVMRGADDALGRHVEAYSWGGLTGRSQVRALWLLVLPFALINLAGWMNPDRTDGTHRALVRLIGVALTALYVLFAAVITMDFVAYQCAGAAGCAAAGWPLVGSDSAAGEPARRVVIGALGPLAVVSSMAALTRTSRRRYECWRPDGPTVAPAQQPPVGTSPADRGLTDPGFWSGQGYAWRLAHVHHFTGLAVVALLLAATAQARTDAALAPALVVTCSVALLLAVPLALGTRLRTALPTPALVPVGAVLVAATAVVAWTGAPATGPTARPLPGILLTFDAVLAVLYAAVLSLLVVPAVRALRPRRNRTADIPGRWVRLRRRFTPFAVCVLASLLTPAFLAGTALWVAQRLGETASVGRATADTEIVYPQPYEALARGLLVAILVALLTALVAGGLAWGRVGRASWERLLQHWSAAPPVPGRIDAQRDPAWCRGVQRALRIPAASLAALEWTLWTLAVLITAASVAYSGYWLIALLVSGRPDSYLDVEVPVTLPLPPLGLSTWVLTSLPVLCAIVMRRGLRHPSARRRIAVAWDVTTFWPRSFHPLAPPSYAERAVPELQGRLYRIWKAGGSVLLLAHSQGAVLATAAIAALPRTTAGLDRTAVVSYGNPVHRLYARHFPAYVDSDVVEAAIARPGSWRNFHRDTDYVGDRLRPAGSTEGPDLDEYLPDPATDHHVPGDQRPEVRSHGERGYRRQSGFVRYLTARSTALLQRRDPDSHERPDGAENNAGDGDAPAYGSCSTSTPPRSVPR